MDLTELYVEDLMKTCRHSEVVQVRNLYRDQDSDFYTPHPWSFLCATCSEYLPDPEVFE